MPKSGRGAARCVRQDIPWAVKHFPRELALSGPWSGYLAPTCTCRPWEDANANGQGGSTFPRAAAAMKLAIQAGFVARTL